MSIGHDFRRPVRSAVLFLFLFLIPAVGEAAAQGLAWAGRVGGPDNDFARMAVDGAGNVFLTGQFQGTVDFDPDPNVAHTLTSAGLTDIFLLKLDSDGRFAWAKRMGGPAGDSGYCIAINGSGAVYVVGSFAGTADLDPDPSGTRYLTATGSYDSFVSKLDADGNLTWARQMGGYPNSLALDAAGNLLLTGGFQGTEDFDPDPAVNYLLSSSAPTDDGVIVSLDPEGVLRWAKQIDGNDSVQLYDIAGDANGNVYVTGFFGNSADFNPDPAVSYVLTGNADSFLLKLDANGQFVWAFRVGGPFQDDGLSVAVDDAGNIYTTGDFETVVNFNPMGAAYNLTSSSRDVFVAAYRPNGTLIWAKRMGGGNAVYSTQVAVGPTGNVHVAGSFYGTADFDPDPSATYSLTSADNWEFYLQTLHADGTFAWVESFGGAQDDWFPEALVIDDAGRWYVAGTFRGTVDFDPDPSLTYPLTSAGDLDVFVLKLSSCSAADPAAPYGRFLFQQQCAADASTLTQDVYSTRELSLFRTPRERFYLSSQGASFASLAVDDAVHVNGQDSGLGPYAMRAGVPPLRFDVPITDNLVPEPPQEITALLPAGGGTASFELRDTERTIFGNTPVFLVADCGIYLQPAPPDLRINFVSHDDQWENDLPAARAPIFDVRYGLLSHLRADAGFARIQCAGHFTGTPAIAAVGNPAVGDGFYFLAKEWGAPPGGGCFPQDYGDSNVTPDPRDFLDTLELCP